MNGNPFKITDRLLNHLGGYTLTYDIDLRTAEVTDQFLNPLGDYTLTYDIDLRTAEITDQFLNEAKDSIEFEEHTDQYGGPIAQK